MSDEQQRLAGFCGIYCGSCPVYRADRDGDEPAKFRLAFATRCTLDKIRCEGCRSSARFVLSEHCMFRRCAKGRGLEGCTFCRDYPCETILSFYGDGTQLQADAQDNARRIREIGIDAWLEEADRKSRCGRCGKPIATGAGHTCRT